MPPIFIAFINERPPIFALHAHQKLENFVFLKQNRAIWWILSGANLFKVMKAKFQFYRLNRPNCALISWMNFIGGQGWYTCHHPPGQTQKGIYPTTTFYRSAHLGSLNKCQAYLSSWGCASGGILSVRCNYAGPAEGPRKILKYRSNLRLYPVNFSNKSGILIFIVLSIWPNFFDPPPHLYYGNYCLVPPFWQLKTFLPPPPPFCPAPPPPPPMDLWTLHKWRENGIHQSAYRKYHSTETALRARQSYKRHFESCWQSSPCHPCPVRSFCCVRYARPRNSPSTFSGTIWYYRQCPSLDDIIFPWTSAVCGYQRHSIWLEAGSLGCLWGSVFGPMAFSFYSAPVEDIIMSHGLECMIYAEDTPSMILKWTPLCRVSRSVFQILGVGWSRISWCLITVRRKYFTSLRVLFLPHNFHHFVLAVLKSHHQLRLAIWVSLSTSM